MSGQNNFLGIASLIIREALLLNKEAHNFLPENEMLDVLRDWAASHEIVVGIDNEVGAHRVVGSLVIQTTQGSNAMRCP